VIAIVTVLLLRGAVGRRATICSLL